ncbi:hypothetical protein N7466_003428 [Penicillium verhagenii]|uniref:uncharacterized protein n=1 Tax=Penicillium verhagenii TaxID=1562060 RepID=UPI0025452623|nr:uncharacterized protein N7466_003428 [Penicillium verhagenii]KAJ5936978.1 hypothetical protein N7466_003428 [Penicillium verhagenii]
MPDPKDQASIRQALDRARSGELPVDAATSRILESAITDLWARIQAQQDTIILSPDEFALFNYFLERFRVSQHAITQRVVNRYWNSFHDANNGKK